MLGETIHVSIFQWHFEITRQNETHGTQTNVFTQYTRNIRRTIGPPLYFDYRFANVVLLNDTRNYGQRIKESFHQSMPKEHYAITDCIPLRLSTNAKYQKYRNVLKQQCKLHNKRKDEMETMVWKINAHSREKYAHCNHANEIIGNDETHSIYFCRAICAKHGCLDDIIDSLPLYCIHFNKIQNHVHRKSVAQSNLEPLLSLKQSYGSFRRSKTERKKNKKTNKHCPGMN